MALLTSLVRAALAPRYRVSIEPEWGAGPIVGGADAARLYRTQPNLRAVVGFLSDNAASVPWKVYDRVADGDRVRVTDSPAALLLARPNAHVTAYEWRRRLFADLYLYDRHLSIVVPDADAPSGWAMWPVPAPWLDGYVGGTAWAPETLVLRVPSTGRGVEVPASSCLWLHGYDPADPMRQSSPVEALADLLDEQMESATFRRQMWRRGGRFNAYVTRPKDVERWTNEAFERFRRTWNESWAGAGGSQAGAMPILEDGMEIRQVQFNAREAEWSEAKRLGREDVAGVYHVNPALIWPGSGQTYASAKENARALYNDTLAPRLMEATDKANAALLPMVGEPRGHYVEYDLAVKLQGSFEERASVIQSAVGGPWMTRDEARSQFNLPHIDGADQLIVPLNVTEGGLASPNDTDPTVERYDGPSGHKCGCKGGGHTITYKSEATDADTEAAVGVLRSFFERQARSVLPKIRAAKARGALAKDDAPDWWDVTRWDSELEADLFEATRSMSDEAAARALRAIGADESMWEPGEAAAFLRSMCQQRAAWVNDTTRRELLRALELQEAGAEGLMATPEGVFENAAENRSESAGNAFATAVDGWATLEACRQTGIGGITKQWVVTSRNPRPSHAAMNGERVPIESTFSNGMEWPGDWAGGPDEVCGCQCTVSVSRTI